MNISLYIFLIQPPTPPHLDETLEIVRALSDWFTTVYLVHNYYVGAINTWHGRYPVNIFE